MRAMFLGTEGRAIISEMDEVRAFRDLSDERIRMFTDILKEGNIKNLKVIEA